MHYATATAFGDTSCMSQRIRRSVRAVRDGRWEEYFKTHAL